MSNYVLRELTTMLEFNAIPTLEAIIWGDAIPMQPDFLRAMQDEGALIGGAFFGSELIGFILGFPTRDATVQHSHQMGILESHRSAGLGAKLKWWQRNWCLEHGITSVRWTFDPLRIANAKLNIQKLGATASTYLEDYYGAMAGINAGTPSDRLLVNWDLCSERVAARLEGRILEASKEAVLVRLPLDFIQLNQVEALKWRLQVRNELQDYFCQGYQITNLTLEPGAAYILEPGAAYIFEQ